MLGFFHFLSIYPHCLSESLGLSHLLFHPNPIVCVCLESVFSGLLPRPESVCLLTGLARITCSRFLSSLLRPRLSKVAWPDPHLWRHQEVRFRHARTAMMPTDRPKVIELRRKAWVAILWSMESFGSLFWRKLLKPICGNDKDKIRCA
jgi:hypothetical protein